MARNSGQLSEIRIDPDDSMQGNGNLSSPVENFRN